MDNKFTEKQLKAIHLLATKEIKGLSMDDIAQFSGCGKASLYRWMEEPAFKRAVNEQALKEISNLSPQILGTTAKMLNSNDLKIQAKGVDTFSRITEKVEKAELELKKQQEEENKGSIDDFLVEIGVISKGWDRMTEVQKLDWDIKVTKKQLKECENNLKFLLEQREKLTL